MPFVEGENIGPYWIMEQLGQVLEYQANPV